MLTMFERNSGSGLVEGKISFKTYGAGPPGSLDNVLQLALLEVVDQIEAFVPFTAHVALRLAQRRFRREAIYAEAIGPQLPDGAPA